MEETEQLQSTLEQLDAEKKVGIKSLGKKQINAAQYDEFLQQVLVEYGENGDKGIKVISKAKA